MGCKQSSIKEGDTAVSPNKLGTTSRMKNTQIQSKVNNNHNTQNQHHHHEHSQRTPTPKEEIIIKQQKQQTIKDDDNNEKKLKHVSSSITFVIDEKSETEPFRIKGELHNDETFERNSNSNRRRSSMASQMTADRRSSIGSQNQQRKNSMHLFSRIPSISLDRRDSFYDEEENVERVRQFYRQMSSYEISVPRSDLDDSSKNDVDGEGGEDYIDDTLSYTSSSIIGKSSIINYNKQEFCVERSYEKGTQMYKQFQVYLRQCDQALTILNQKWALNAPPISDWNLHEIDAPLIQSKLTNPPDIVLVSQAWNKVLAFRSMFTEGLIGRWRIMVAMEYITQTQNHKARQQQSNPVRKTLYHLLSPISNFQKTYQTPNLEAIHLVETDQDPLAFHFGTRIVDLDILIFTALDFAVHSLCPHQEVIQREGYRMVQGSIDVDPKISSKFVHVNECKTLEDCFHWFGRYGLHPQYWLIFCDAFIWTLLQQNPYILEDEKDDLQHIPHESCIARFISGMFVLPIIGASLRRSSYIRRVIFQEELRVFCSSSLLLEHFHSLGLQTFHHFFEDFPEIADHFSKKEGDDMAWEFFEM